MIQFNLLLNFNISIHKLIIFNISVRNIMLNLDFIAFIYKILIFLVVVLLIYSKFKIQKF